MGRKSISLRLDRAKNKATAQEIIGEWRESWDYDTRTAVKYLFNALENRDVDMAKYSASKLLPLTQKRLGALKNVADALINKDWHDENDAPPYLAKHQSAIAQQIDSARSKAAVQEVMAEWQESWEYDMRHNVQRIFGALAKGDLDMARRVTEELLPATRDQLDALEAVAAALMYKTLA